MTRKEFLQTIPIGAGIAFSLMCTGSCNQADRLATAANETTSLRTDSFINPSQEPVDFVIDLNTPTYQKLKTPGEYAFYKDVIIVFTDDEKYLAASKICSDEWIPRVIWDGKEFYCLAHGATFDRQGNGTTTKNNLGFRGLDIFNVSLDGNLLHVYS